MLIIPAIDLKGGKCVRLYQGEIDKATVYADDPAEMARRWQEEGAKRLHVVDLDGAVSGPMAMLATSRWRSSKTAVRLCAG
jgi:phosphoribosylformimino-5-aminoimidazole carboxamide ribotide isomerase